jgi:hypothetical protein
MPYKLKHSRSNPARMFALCMMSLDDGGRSEMAKAFREALGGIEDAAGYSRTEEWNEMKLALDEAQQAIDNLRRML